jgi:hypothetical protein
MQSYDELVWVKNSCAEGENNLFVTSSKETGYFHQKKV